MDATDGPGAKGSMVAALAQERGRLSLAVLGYSALFVFYTLAATIILQKMLDAVPSSEPVTGGLAHEQFFMFVWSASGMGAGLVGLCLAMVAVGLLFRHASRPIARAGLVGLILFAIVAAAFIVTRGSDAGSQARRLACAPPAAVAATASPAKPLFCRGITEPRGIVSILKIGLDLIFELDAVMLLGAMILLSAHASANGARLMALRRTHAVSRLFYGSAAALTLITLTDTLFLQWAAFAARGNGNQEALVSAGSGLIIYYAMIGSCILLISLVIALLFEGSIEGWMRDGSVDEKVGSWLSTVFGDHALQTVALKSFAIVAPILAAIVGDAWLPGT